MIMMRSIANFVEKSLMRRIGMRIKVI